MIQKQLSDNAHKRLILASSSPRRVELLERAGFDLRILPPEVDENIAPGTDMNEAAQTIALKKALWAEQRCLVNAPEVPWLADAPEPPNIATLPDDSAQPACSAKPAYIVAADTLVWTDRALGKPENRTDLIHMLQELNGRCHSVVTGVALLEAGAMRHIVFSETSRVCFKNYDYAFIEAYADTAEPYDKAGGYAIQGSFSRWIDSVEGDRDNVMGFPLRTFLAKWEQFTGGNF
ncbi:MAG TPA: Maf-like protein [Clostridiales bacterium]|jgi:septum formation protein|nr:Maf-like protein [Clostridiales bacterium]